MDNLLATNPSLVSGLNSTTGSSTALSLACGARFKNHPCLTKAIGPFDGDNNNNDGNTDQRFSHTTTESDLSTTKSRTAPMDKLDLATVRESLNAVQNLPSAKIEKMKYNEVLQTTSLTRGCIKNRGSGNATTNNSEFKPNNDEVKKNLSEVGGGFEVYNVEADLPKIDWEAMETYLRAARDEEKKRRNDREEIRRRLAMGVEVEEPILPKKSSLHSRLQSGMNLQICFMNETASDGSDGENQRIDDEKMVKSFEVTTMKEPYNSLPAVTTNPQSLVELDFFAQQAKLQMEARTALAQAKELARVQMQVERQQRKHTRISDLVRQSVEKLGIPFPWDCRRLSRQILTELSIAQLQVIVNDLHSQIEGLNEELVQLLLRRDDCHMEQDSMLVDIEDLTRYLTAKQAALEANRGTLGPVSLPVQDNSPPLSTKQRLRSFARIPGLRK